MKYIVISILGLLSGCSAFQGSPRKPTILFGAVSESVSGYVIQETGDALYVGYLKDGMPDGRGTMYLKNKTVMTGDWVNGNLVGDGVIISIDTGSYSVGGFENGVQNGVGYISVDGKGFYGNIADGVPDGLGGCYEGGEIKQCDPLD